MEAALDALFASHEANVRDHKEIISQFVSLVNQKVFGEVIIDLNNIKLVIARILSEQMSPIIMRPCVIHFINKVVNIPETCEYYVEILDYCIKQLKSVNFDDADYTLRLALFNYFRKDPSYLSEAAKVLSGVNIQSATVMVNQDGVNVPFTPYQKANIYILCAECCAEVEEFIEAESFVSKAGPYINEINDSDKNSEENKELNLRFKLMSAAVLDYNRKFVEAAVKYHEVSTTTYKKIVQEDLLFNLYNAIICAVLGKAGPQRSRVLGLIYNDERFRNLDQHPAYSSHACVLTKMYLQQLIGPEEENNFESTLKEHQKAITADGFTVYKKAIIEHNIVAISKIYDNITIKELSNLLSLDPLRAEKLVARMISEDRLHGTIDQIEGLLIFDVDKDVSYSIDNRIKNICSEISSVFERCVESK